MSIFSCCLLTVLGREGVISSVETQDGHCCILEFIVWAGINVIVCARFITEHQRGEAFVKLTDSPRLEERDDINIKIKMKRKSHHT